MPWVCASMKPRTSWVLLTPENGLPVTLVVTSGKSVQPVRLCSLSAVGVRADGGVVGPVGQVALAGDLEGELPRLGHLDDPVAGRAGRRGVAGGGLAAVEVAALRAVEQVAAQRGRLEVERGARCLRGGGERRHVGVGEPAPGAGRLEAVAGVEHVVAVGRRGRLGRADRDVGELRLGLLALGRRGADGLAGLRGRGRVGGLGVGDRRGRGRRRSWSPGRCGCARGRRRRGRWGGCGCRRAGRSCRIPGRRTARCLTLAAYAFL